MPTPIVLDSSTEVSVGVPVDPASAVVLHVVAATVPQAVLVDGRPT